MSLAAGPTPASGVLELRERVMEAAERGTGLRVVGAGSWLDAGRPVRAMSMARTSSLGGIVDYTPGDLTLTARAGTTLAEIARATEAEGQWLALDPFGSSEGTIGATVATASAGPLAHAFGTPRDQLLGLEALTGSGVFIRAGGRVVKNVAGFDLVRLFTGSWGTLGIITELTIRLRALPVRSATFRLALHGDAPRRAEQLAAVRGARLAAHAVEVVSAALAARLGLARQDVLLARLAGNDAVIEAQRDALARIGPVEETGADVWQALRQSEPARAAVVRFSRAPAHFLDCWDAATRAGAPEALVHGTPSRGIARAIVPYEDDDALEPLASAMRGWQGALIAERLPARMWGSTRLASPIADRLSRGIRERFDPMHVLNPGILGSLA